MTVQIRLYDSDLTKRKLYILCCRITRHQNGEGRDSREALIQKTRKRMLVPKLLLFPAFYRGYESGQCNPGSIINPLLFWILSMVLSQWHLPFIYNEHYNILSWKVIIIVFLLQMNLTFFLLVLLTVVQWTAAYAHCTSDSETVSSSLDYDLDTV